MSNESPTPSMFCSLPATSRTRVLVRTLSRRVTTPFPFVGLNTSESRGSISMNARMPRPIGPTGGFPTTLHENMIRPMSGKLVLQLVGLPVLARNGPSRTTTVITAALNLISTSNPPSPGSPTGATSSLMVRVPLPTKTLATDGLLKTARELDALTSMLPGTASKTAAKTTTAAATYAGAGAGSFK